MSETFIQKVTDQIVYLPDAASHHYVLFLKDYTMIILVNALRIF